MIYGLYAIKDDKTGFMTPTVDISDAAAERNFAHAIVSTKGLFYTHPADFALYKLATYNTSDGSIHTSSDQDVYPVLIASAVDLKEMMNDELQK